MPVLPAGCTGNTWWCAGAVVGVDEEPPPVDDAEPAGTTRRMWAFARTLGRTASSTDPTATTRTRIPTIQVSAFSQPGAFMRRRARATWRRPLRSSARGTTGNVPVGGPVETWYL